MKIVPDPDYKPTKENDFEKEECKNFRCSECQLLFLTEKYLKIHVAKVHTPVRCNNCKNVFLNNKWLENHFCKNDPGEKNKIADEGPKEIKKEENTETIDGRKENKPINKEKVKAFLPNNENSSSFHTSGFNTSEDRLEDDLTNEDLSFLDEDMPWPEPMAGMDISKKWNFCQDTTEGKNRSLL